MHKVGSGESACKEAGASGLIVLQVLLYCFKVWVAFEQAKISDFSRTSFCKFRIGEGDEAVFFVVIGVSAELWKIVIIFIKNEAEREIDDGVENQKNNDKNIALTENDEEGEDKKNPDGEEAEETDWQELGLV